MCSLPCSWQTSAQASRKMTQITCPHRCWCLASIEPRKSSSAIHIPLRWTCGLSVSHHPMHSGCSALGTVIGRRRGRHQASGSFSLLVPSVAQLLISRCLAAPDSSAPVDPLPCLTSPRLSFPCSHASPRPSLPVSLLLQPAVCTSYTQGRPSSQVWIITTCCGCTSA